MDVNGSSAGGSAEELCRRVHPRLVKSLALFCGDESAAEELAQEALIRAWDRWPSVSQMSSPEGWVFRVAFNLATSRARRRAVEARALAAAAAAGPPGAPDVDEAIVVRGAVAALPPRERAAIVLRYFADLPVKEVAAVMGCQPGTVKSLTSHAMTHLDRLLRDRVRERVIADG